MSFQRALITGINGFVGGYLTDALAERSIDVAGLGTEARNDAPFQYFSVDMRDPEAVAAAVRAARPDLVIHLAGISSVRQSMEFPELTFAVNVDGTRHLLDAVRAHAPAATSIIVSSGEVYAAKDEPLVETDPLDGDANPYAASRVAQEALVRDYPDLAIRVSRSFNHTGPRQRDAFVLSSFAKQIVEIEAGHKPPRMEVGNLDVVRDFSDVRDVVAAYLLMAERGENGAVYNIASGKGYKIRDVLRMLIQLSGQEVEVAQSETRVRQGEKPTLVGDPGKFVAATRWQREYDLEMTLGDMLEYWRREISR